MSYRAAEAEATTLRFCGPLLVPGLLKTEGYVHAHDQSADVVAARLERQQVIGRARVTAVIDHTVLLRCVGGSPQIMADQCAHLSALAGLLRHRPDVSRGEISPPGPNASEPSALSGLLLPAQTRFWLAKPPAGDLRLIPKYETCAGSRNSHSRSRR
ncbi:MAG: Scr1 family TA system antitoxin-like transcriptional regulator [Trebonia sp.]